MISFQLIFAISCAFAAAFAFYPAIRWNRGPRSLMWFLVSMVVALSPCVVSLSAKPHRMIATLTAIAILPKLYDLLKSPNVIIDDLTFSSYCIYIANWFWLVLRRKPACVPTRSDYQRLVSAVPVNLAIAFVFVWVFSLDWSGESFAVEHSLKVTTLVFAIATIGNIAASGWRVLGGTALDPMIHPGMARTPADFWRRWNRPAQQFIYQYAFLPAGGMRAPIRGTLGAFVVNGLLHEYVFGVATGQVQGWQISYFILQGVAVALTMRMRPRGWIELVCIAATIAFNLLAAVLFFKSVDKIVHFYSTRNVAFS